MMLLKVWSWIPIFSLVLCKPKEEAFDYIVVGAGPAGSMAAMGLAEKGHSTLLIDAGSDYMSGNITTPALHLRAGEDPNIAWDFHVKHYEESTGLRQKVLYPRVAGLGGCTLHNALLHVLPNKEDYEKMVKLTGDKSWSESNMRKYYNRMVKPNVIERLAPLRALNHLGTEFQNISTMAANMFEDKKDAWLKLNTVDLFNLLADDAKLLDLVTNILQGALISNIFGFDINSYDGMGGVAIDQENTFLVPMSSDITKGHQRVGVYERLKEVQNKINLTVWTDTLATKIILDDKTKAARGIEFLQGKHLYKAGKIVKNKKSGKPGKVFARKEVIISAGTFNTPQLMMLSGIGDFKHLKEMGIKPKVNLPGVGRNLHDRYEVSLNVKFNEPFAILDGCKFIADESDPCYQRYTQTATGPYTFNGILTGTTTKSSPELRSPDIFTLSNPSYFTGYYEGMADKLPINKDMFSFVILKAHTNNHQGTVRLASDDPTDMPDINFRYFSEGEEQDLPPLINAIRDARKKLEKFSSNFTEIHPGPKVQSDAQITNFIKEHAWGHHATGTMKMGNPKDKYSVLDSEFRVQDVKNLRVVDMSIFPEIPGYFPVLYLYMVGMKAADTITSAST